MQNFVTFHIILRKKCILYQLHLSANRTGKKKLSPLLSTLPAITFLRDGEENALIENGSADITNPCQDKKEKV